ncbi:MAG: LPS export ABC transporter permease LptG [Pseudomonadota bacterium]
MSFTLAAYIARTFLQRLGLVLVIVAVLIIIGDLIEMARNLGSSGAGGVEVFTMALLHMPTVLGSTLPFVFMLASMAAFLQLARSSELVVTRAAGVSAWRLILPVMLCAGVLGVVAFAALNPIAATTLSRYETMNARYFKGQASLLSVSGKGLWLRQAEESGQTVIRAARSNADGTRLLLPTLFRFDENGRLVGRIEAESAELSPGVGAWIMADATEWRFGPELADAALPVARDEITVPTTLTSERILDGFAPPQSLSFWDLPRFIAILEAAGFTADRHRLYYQAELAKPLLFMAMVLLGGAFSMRTTRFGGVGIMILAAVMTGFVLFFVSDVTQALGGSGALPPLIAVWVPPASAMLGAMGLLFYLEDG